MIEGMVSFSERVGAQAVGQHRDAEYEGPEDGHHDHQGVGRVAGRRPAEGRHRDADGLDPVRATAPNEKARMRAKIVTPVNSPAAGL